MRKNLRMMRKKNTCTHSVFESKLLPLIRAGAIVTRVTVSALHHLAAAGTYTYVRISQRLQVTRLPFFEIDFLEFTA